MEKVLVIVLNVICYSSVTAYYEFETPRNAFDTDLYANVLDEELCGAQLSYIKNNSSMLRAEFLDSGLRAPRGILQGNLVDFGNYHQCLAISENFEQSAIEGKYCMINVPFKQENFGLPTHPEWPEKWPEGWPEWPEEWPEFPWPELIPNTRRHREMMRNIRKVQAETARFSHLIGTDTDLIQLEEDSDMADQAFRLAVCIPKACTTKHAIDSLLINTTAVGLEFTDEFCRLKNDKPFVPGDYVAMGIFGFIILITILCTSYDLHYNFIRKGEPKEASTIGKSFSLYTNTRRLLTFNPAPDAVESLDGIRAIAMAWVIVGHTYSTQLNALNRLDMLSWMGSFSAIWIMSTPITVDTFFLLSGLLIVYTSVGKLSRMRFIRSVHLYYLHRLLRLFPLLATCILLQASLLNHISDGPEWHIVADKVNRCRTYWWSTLTYLQIYLTNSWCIGPTWYLAIDVQLYIISPLVLFWVLDKQKSAWIALSLAMIISLIASTVYIYLNAFQPGPMVPARPAEDSIRYTKFYYVNTLTRCTPFFVGMLFGYLLYVCKGTQVHLSKVLVALYWAVAFLVSASIIYSTYPILQPDWYSPFLDGVINSFSRPGWAACLGWMIFACTHGYGGPINWFLSLPMWKLPARISFAMYLFHYPLIHVVNATAVAPAYFSVVGYFYRFLADFTMAFVVGFIVTVMIDSPFSTIIKLVMDGGLKKPNLDKLVTKEENSVNGEAGMDNQAFRPDADRHIT